MWAMCRMMVPENGLRSTVKATGLPSRHSSTRPARNSRSSFHGGEQTAHWHSRMPERHSLRHIGLALNCPSPVPQTKKSCHAGRSEEPPYCVFAFSLSPHPDRGDPNPTMCPIIEAKTYHFPALRLLHIPPATAHVLTTFSPQIHHVLHHRKLLVNHWGFCSGIP
jgi:hypothetical protein